MPSNKSYDRSYTQAHTRVRAHTQTRAHTHMHTHSQSQTPKGGQKQFPGPDLKTLSNTVMQLP